MKGHEIINSIVRDKMPDREQVRETCHRQAARMNTKRKIRVARLLPISACVIVAIVVVLMIGKSEIKKTQIKETNNIKHAQTAMNENQNIENKKTVQATVLLSLNPAVEFQVDADAMIISVTGTNEDGVALIEGIDFTGFSFENATIVVVNKLIEKNYILASSIEKNILLSVSGETDHMNLLEVMSATIKAAAAQYEMNVDTVQTDAKQLEIILANAQDGPEDEASDDNKLPESNPQELPTHMEIEYKLTGKVNNQKDIGWQDVDGVRVFQHGYSEVEDVFFTVEGGKRYRAHQILELDTAGDWLNSTTLWVICTLSEKGYISSDLQGQIVLYIKGCTQKQYDDTKELIAMMLKEAKLPLAVQEINGIDKLRIVPSSIPEMYELSHYTLSQLLDVKFNKEQADVTELQMKILSMAFTEEGAIEQLRPRYWAVIPNFIGLTEEEAVNLCDMTGFMPVIVHEPFSNNYSEVNSIGSVFYQDLSAGYTYGVGMPIQLNIWTNKPEVTIPQ